MLWRVSVFADNGTPDGPREELSIALHTGTTEYRKHFSGHISAPTPTDAPIIIAWRPFEAVPGSGCDWADVMPRWCTGPQSDNGVLGRE